MPFIPSSPTRLYTFGKKGSLRTGNSSQDIASRDTDSRIGKLRKIQPKPTNSEAIPSQRSEETMNDSIRSDTHRELQTSDLPKEVEMTTVETSSQTEGERNSMTPEEKSVAPTSSKPRYSFFDNASDSEYSVNDDDDSQAIVGRASSVRVSKPMIVQHKHTTKSHALGSNLYQGGIPEEAESESGGSSTLHLVSVPANQEDEPNQDTLILGTKLLQDSQQTSTDMKRLGIENVNSKTLETSSTPQSTHSISVSASSTESHSTEIPQNINRAMSSPLPLPGKGLSRRVTIRPSDIVIGNGRGRDSFRESIVTTPYPKRRDSDGTSMNFDATRNSSTESIASDKPIGPSKSAASEPASASSSKGKGKSAANNRTPPQGEKDRFPSPERSETLFLDLSLARHPLARTTLEIQIAKKSTFDDEALFIQIRAAYTKRLLGTRRWPFTLLRRIGYVTVPDNTSSTDFNSIDFLKHLHTPRLGRKRKAWVIWLRNNNPRAAARTAMGALVQPASAHIKTLQSLDELARPRKLSLTQTLLSAGRRGSRGNNKSHHTEKNPVAGVDNHPVSKRFSVTSDTSTAGSFNFVYSPAIARLPFLSQTQRESSSPAVSPVRSFFWPNNLSSALSSSTMSPSLRHANETGGSRIATVSFQHEFRFGVVALLTLGVVLQAVGAAVIWVIFGVPGARPGMSGNGDGLVNLKSDWRLDARERVLTGIIIGLVVFLVGCLGEGALIWGSWLLL